MEYPIFDTHAHYSARAFDSDRFALLDSLPGSALGLGWLLPVTAVLVVATVADRARAAP